MNNFTPGPWALGPNATVYGTPAGKPYTITVADCCGYKAEREANAALISAAPELLAALEDMLALMGPLDDIANIRRKQVAKAAIAKAKGITVKGYIAIYKGKQIEVYAESSYAAQNKAAATFKAKKSYEVAVYLAERADGSTVTQIPE